MQPVLVIMAAGMGSRYGGLKQMDPVDPAGNLIIDFSIFDALKAGFEEVIFIIKEELEGDFRSAIGDRISHHARVRYAFQRLAAAPSAPSMRTTITAPPRTSASTNTFAAPGPKENMPWWPGSWPTPLRTTAPWPGASARWKTNT